MRVKYYLPHYYFTSKLEIKPQQTERRSRKYQNYFTSKLEIKPQLPVDEYDSARIILHQN